MASVRPGPFQDFYQAALAKGIKSTMARLTLARSRRVSGRLPPADHDCWG